MLGNTGSTSKDVVVPADTVRETPVWQEIKNDDGNIYYWNTNTNETTWDPPDSYISLAQQEKNKLKLKEEQKREKILKKQKHKEATIEVKAHIARESMRELAVAKDVPPPVKTDVAFGPAPCVRPYGTWKPVIREPEQKIDLQLPKSDKEIIPPPVVMEPETIVFKEKRIESLGDGPVEFKKRKFNNPKRNMRQKLDDD